MIDDTLGKIESSIQDANSITPERKQELLKLVGRLKSEVGQLSTTHGEQARRIADYTQASTQQATSDQKDDKVLESSLEDLRSSVREFETSHPRLAQIVSAISHQLSNLGI